MFSKFFIERPIFANVIAIVTIAHRRGHALPPADRAVSRHHAADRPGHHRAIPAPTRGPSRHRRLPIEQEVNGVEGMLYMSSYAATDGSYTLTVTFEVGTDLDMAQVLVQNRVAIALPMLPQEVQVQGVTAKKKSTTIIMVVALTSPDDSRYDSLFLSNYATLRLKDELARIHGVGDVSVFGAGNIRMRIWIDPESSRPAA